MHLDRNQEPQYSLIAWAIIFIAFLIKAFYIFKLTSYATSIQFDMSAFWNGAFQRLQGDDYNIGQYAIFPTFYIFFLHGFLEILKNLGLIGQALNIIILSNLILSAVSAYAVYIIIDKLVTHKILSFLALFLYAFSYTTTYINALVLPENLAVPLLIIIVAIIVSRNLDWKRILLIGFITGLIVAAKPVLIFLSVAFIYHISKLSFKRAKYWQILLLILAFLSTPVFVIYQNYKISDGKLFGLGAYGGGNFYAAWANLKKIESHSKSDGNWWISFPSTFNDSTAGNFTTEQPFYNQKYFYKLGIEEIIHNPKVTIEKATRIDRLFFGTFAPTLSREPYGYYWLMNLSQWMFYGAFLSLGLLGMYFLRYSQKDIILFLYALLGLFLAGLYSFGTFDRRYLQFAEFLIVILFFVTIDQIWKFYKPYRKEISIYFLLVFVMFVFVPFVYNHSFLFLP